jgi:hypothetical protein
MKRPFVGRYINLDRSPERRVAVEDRLAALGLAPAYRRFPAIDGTKLTQSTGTISQREYGCFASHAAVLREAAAEGTHLHVLEDDLLLSEELVVTLDRLAEDGFLEYFDLIFTDVGLAPDVRVYGEFERARSRNMRLDPRNTRETFRELTMLDLHNTPWFGTTSYVAAGRSLARIAGLLDSQLSAGPSLPIDLVLRRLVNRRELKAACVIPFVTSPDFAPEMSSTVRPEGVDSTRLSLLILRHALFIRPDWPLIDDILSRHFPESADRRHRTVGRIMDFVVFGDMKWI